jgi:arylsulfatase A
MKKKMVLSNASVRSHRPVALALLTCISPVLHQSCSPEQDKSSDQKPNIVLILADDMGYGDVASLNPYARTQTPAIDRLVDEGITFTNAYASGTTCIPSRYGILTGRYLHRRSGSPHGRWGYAEPFIEPERETLASLLSKAGYTSACIGKWHLGLGWQTRDGAPAVFDGNTRLSNVDFSLEVTSGPNNYGFDYSFIHPASLDMPPYMFLRNHQVVDPDIIIDTDFYPARLPDTQYAWDKKHTDEHAVYWEKGVWWQKGEMSRSFRIEDCHSEILRESIEFIEGQVLEKPDSPFFLYLSLTGPHTPWVPGERFKGKSSIGLYGDFIMDIDDVVDQVKSVLIEHNIHENTILIFTSDNGAYWPQEEIELHDHDSNWSRRGQKADLWDGGHRIPLIISWPGRITKPFVYNNLVSHTDFFSTLAELFGLEMDNNMGEDSFSFSQVLDGDKETMIRQTMIQHSSRRYSIRDSEWKYIEGLGSGGFTQPSNIQPQPGGPKGQLYRILTDSLELENLYLKYPDQLTRLQNDLEIFKYTPERIKLNENYHGNR